MRIEELWEAMEAEVRAGAAAAWVTRHALPKCGYPLLIALDPATSRRALLLPVSRAAIPPRRQWPDCRGLEVFGMLLGDQSHLGVRLRDQACLDVFTALAEDVAPRVAAAADEKTAAAVLLNRLHRWQKFLAAGIGGLSPERQRGLFAELYTLRAHLLPGLGTATAIAGWRAPLATHQDFQYATGAVEVKSTTAMQPQTVRIASERQLDDAGIPALFLHVVILDEREVEGEGAVGGETLPSLIQSLRQSIASDEQVGALFEDRLLESGYLAVDAPRYETRHWALRQEQTFRVRAGFPRLTETNVPLGVGDVSYALDLAAVHPFAVAIAEMLAALQMPD